ncbi:hypothetical protein BT63DRAFT_429940 [Microthyrium microscopicum]|uniref:Uncharacterized protein n=1 Tax=Microthyrium microscopicum TaxID=703497 RepID=A0A6A6TV95_9PEZI|nr:hypothetical protein BT63DRAFT_429940 [Microthyrium microscopicum]
MFTPKHILGSMLLATVTLCSPLAANQPACSFVPSTTYYPGDSRLSEIVASIPENKAYFANLLAEGNWSPVDGCANFCCACPVVQPNVPGIYTYTATPCKTSPGLAKRTEA